MKNKYLILFILILNASLSINTQPKCFFTHYGAEDGLPQHTVMDILQDQKGFMWFSTWNGLCKFDGYNFYTYKIQQGDAYHMRSNRIDSICEDKYGYIWTIPYDREPHRFDPRTETFMGLRSLEAYKDFTFATRKIVPTKSGQVWLLSDKMGCVNVVDSSFRIELYNVENKKIFGNKVFDIYEDQNLNTWILTNNGLYLKSPESEKLNSFFFEKEHRDTKPTQNFYSVNENDNEIWFGSDYGRIWIYSKKDKQFELLKTETSSIIKDIKTIDDSNILICTDNDGFIIYNTLSKDSHKFNTGTIANIATNKILSSYIDKSGNIWFEMDCLGVTKFNPTTKAIKHFYSKIESPGVNVFPPNFFIFEDKENRLWVHPRGGGFALYNASTDQLEPFYNEPMSPTWRFSNMLHSGFPDKQGNLWLCTRSHGLEKVTFNDNVFKSIVIDPNIHSTINNDIRSIFEDSNHNLWVSTKGGKMFVYDTIQKQMGYLCNDGIIGSRTPLNGVIYCMTEDSSHNLWIGTKGEGIYKLTPTGDSQKYKISQYKNSPNDLYSLSSNNVYGIFEDKKQRIWIGTYGGGINLIEGDENPRFINSKNNLKDYPIQYGSQIRTLGEDKYGNICVGTTLGLIMFSPEFETVESIDYKSYLRIPGDNTSLGANDIYDICTTKNGETYFATFGGGLNTISERDENGFPTKFKSYTTKDGLPSDVILTLTQDNEGKIWVVTEGNLTKFDPDKSSFETYSEINRLIDGQNFSEGARFTTKDGVLYFGYSKGLISVDPKRVRNNTFKPYVALTKFQISNKDVPVGEDSFLKQNIDDVEYLKLNYKQNFINIEFAALDYVESKRIYYAYKLEGFDEDWIVTNKQRTANYTNLSPGKYTFKVKSTNSDGIWMNNEHVLDIEITPSFWQTGWAYFLYAILVILILYIILRVLFTMYKLRNKVRLEHEESEMKARFFTDISHEIRTPLTMIVSPVENILEDEQTPNAVKSQLNLVLKNANRMLRMVNQILDFRKIQKQKLNIEEIAIGEYVTDICHNFSKTAEFKNINLIVNNKVGDTKIWVDRDSIEKLMFNLLINAFKHTQVGKTIEVNLFEVKRNTSIAIEVKDEGRGMTKEIQNKLFTRFASFNEDRNNPSTGIGLSIVKEVVDKHHAKVFVESEVGKGSSFTAIFQLGIEHFREDDHIGYKYQDTIIENHVAGTISSDTNKDPEKIDESLNDTDTENQRQTILVVEDDTDLRKFLKTVLASYYDVIEAENGLIGYEKAIKEIPDFILSDIMMPEMDGVEFLQKIKANNTTSHIPFILLTAKTNIESKLEGLDYGADDYITKPFSVKYLRARIDNIIKQRRLLYEVYSREKQPFTIQHTQKAEVVENEHKITSQDQFFIQKVKEEIEKNIDNSDYLIDDLAAAMAMSRTVFFKKLKSLTGFAPIEFIRDIKIKHAAELIESQKYTIKEVSFMIGISDTKYFTQCFKKIFDMTPSEYKNLKKIEFENAGNN